MADNGEPIVYAIRNKRTGRIEYMPATMFLDVFCDRENWEIVDGSRETHPAPSGPTIRAADIIENKGPVTVVTGVEVAPPSLAPVALPQEPVAKAPAKAKPPKRNTGGRPRRAR